MPLKETDSEGARRQRESNLEALRSCRLCIICARSNEAVIVQHQLGAEKKLEGRVIEDVASEHEFYLGNLSTEKGGIPYYITSPTRQDVIFGETALNYEEGKWRVDEGQIKFLPDVKTWGTNSDTMHAFLVKRKRPNWKHGDYISGSAVRMDAKHIFDRVKETQLRDVRALEMEASAFLQVCEYRKVQAFGVVKGVSDKGDGQKGIGNDKHYEPALREAAKAAEDFLKWKFAEMDLPPVDISRQPGAYIVTKHFDHFVEPVVTKAHAMNLTVFVGNGHRKMGGLRIVLPRKINVRTYKNVKITVQSKGLVEIGLPGGEGNTNVYSKGAYFIDLPRTLTNLEHHIDMAAQVKYFRETLEGKIEDLNDSNFTKVITWEEFEELCKEVDAAATPGTPIKPTTLVSQQG